jgi:hypothetical protein
MDRLLLLHGPRFQLVHALCGYPEGRGDRRGHGPCRTVLEMIFVCRGAVGVPSYASRWRSDGHESNLDTRQSSSDVNSGPEHPCVGSSASWQPLCEKQGENILKGQNNFKTLELPTAGLSPTSRLPLIPPFPSKPPRMPSAHIHTPRNEMTSNH